MAIHEILRVEPPSRAEFFRLYGGSPGQPVVFVNAMKDWKAYQLWSFDWFRDTYGDTRLHVNTGRYDVAMTWDYMLLRDYIDTFTHPKPGDSGYLSNVDLFKLIPELRGHVQFPDYAWITRPPFGMYKFWMAKAGTFTQCHRDFQHNMMAHITGVKRFVLFGPTRSPELFPVNRGYSSEFSEADFADADPGKAAIWNSIEPDYDVELGPGEILFLPFGWWHRVHTKSPTIGINLWWWTQKMTLTQGPQMFRELAPRVVKKRLRRFFPKPAAAS